MKTSSEEARSAVELERLVSEHASAMSAAIRRVCGRRHATLVPDVEQEVRLALWKRLQRSGKEIEKPASYVYKVALTTALAVLRSLKLDSTSAIEEEHQIPPAGARGEDGLLPAERSRLLEQALARLEPDQARALRAYLSGFNHREVARLYGWTESTARHRIYRSIEELKRKLTSDA